MKLTVELTRVMQNGKLPMPSLAVEMIPYDKIFLESGEHQVRNINIVEDEILTQQIESMGLLNPIVLMPHGQLYVPVSGHTRTKSCKAILANQPAIAKKHGFYDGMPAYVYKTTLDKLEFSRIANILNDHPKANTLSREDVIKQVYLMISEGVIAIKPNGIPDLDQIKRELEFMKLTTFSSTQLAGIAKTILKNFEKESSYNRGTQGSFKLYDNKSKTNGKLLVNFEVSNETDYIQYNSYTKEALGIFGTKSNNSQQAGEALIKFAFHLQNITNQKYEIKTQTMYLFLTDMVDSHIGETLKETLSRARKTTIEQFKKYAPILKEFMPDKIIFIPQLQIETDEQGNEQFGEDIKNLKWKL
jgi:hypothetical protein